MRVAGASRQVEIAPERIEVWLRGFVERHGATQWAATPQHVVVTAADGGTATFEVPFPPLTVEADQPLGGLAAHALRDRRVGVLLVRLGGYAAGVFDGATLVDSKVGSRLVHGRSAAGGTSQHRFARRREGQARVALQEAADVAVRILAPAAGSLDAVFTGGDKRAVAGVLADDRLAGLRPLVTPRVLDVPDPRLRVLKETPKLFRAVRIAVVDPS
ncbi:MAG: acVLRF1 family peptidyl-tRNA hydrolase [Mycobacteriales bacterium]